MLTVGKFSMTIGNTMRRPGSLVVLCVQTLVFLIRLSHQDDEVRMPPYITTMPSTNLTTYYRYEADLMIHCLAGGTPSPKYRWIFNGRILDPNTVETVPGTGSIKIKNADRRNQGTYQCRAENTYGTAISDEVHLIQANLGTNQNRFSTVYTVYEGEPLKLPCEPTTSIPTATYSWHLALKETESQSPDPYHLSSSRVEVDSDGALVFAHVERGDEQGGKVFKCQNRNEPLGFTVLTGYAKIKVMTNSTFTTRRVQLASHSPRTDTVVALEGQDLVFRCLFSGKPTPEYTWRGPGDSILPSSRFKIDLHDTKMTIVKLVSEDAGTYKCTGQNPDDPSDKTSHSFQLQIKAKPTFQDQPVNTNGTVGEQVVMHCNPTGDPKPNIKWTFNGEDIEKKNPRLTLSADNKTLTLTNVCKQCDSGGTDLKVVQCNASNAHGYVYAEGYINVLEKTEITEPPANIMLRYADRNVTFTCLAKSDLSTPVTYSWLFNEEDVVIKGNDGPRWLLSNGSLVVQVANDSAEISRLCGTYTCVASNSYSTDQAHAVLNCDAAEHVIGEAGLSMWIIILIILLILLILIIVCCCFLCDWLRTRGDVYPVDEKERAHGLYPEEELFETGYHEYQRPEAPSRKPSRADSLGSTMMLEGAGDGRSLGRGYSMDSLGRFTEDGSFIGQYSTARR